MKKSPRVMRYLSVIGLLVFLVGMADPLEGFPLILVGGAMGTLTAWLAAGRWFQLMTFGFTFAVLGAVAMLILSAYGGIGGTSGLPPVWGFTVLPYPIGILVILAGTVLTIRDVFRKPVLDKPPF